MVQYTSKILNWYLKKQDPKSTFAQRIQNFASPVSDFRILLRYYGLIPMLQWILYSEKNPSKNENIKWLTRLQNVMNVCYYPLEVTTLLYRSCSPIGRIASFRVWQPFI